jgi:general stress protein 26
MSTDGQTLHDLAQGIPIVMLTTDGPDDRPRGRPLAVQRIDDDGTVWFIVDRHAEWVGPDLGMAHLAFVDDTTWISATGPATTVDDPATLEELGDPITDTWFQEDAEPIAVRVSVGHADWWDAPGRLRQALSLVGAKVSGSQPDMGERGTADP